MSELTRTIGLGRGTFMMLNIVLGAGLLTLPGLAAQMSGNAAPVVWGACALVAIPLLAVFGILGRKMPSSGGLPAWVRDAFGPYAYAPTILLFLGAVSVGLPSIAITGGYYASAVIGGDPHLLAGLLILAAAAVNLLSAEIAGRANSAIASLLLLVMVVLATIGIATSGTSVAETPLPSITTISPMTFGATFMMIFFAFTGWEVAANLAGEFRDPERTFPRAIALSFVAAVGLYLALAFLVLKAGPVAYGPAPFAAIFSERFGPVGETAVGAVAVALIFANLSAAIWAVSRMVYSVARDGYLPVALTRVTKGVPLRSVGTTVAVLLVVTELSREGIFSLAELLEAAGQNFLLLYAAAAISLMTLSSAAKHRVLAALGITLVAVLIASRPLSELQFPVALILTGLVLAGLHARRSGMTEARS
ncbi:amino acid permease [Alphaproteobacteria bacterium GH1-50]|uniref:Amino acid permease n=1 Tax=Kangsaoukella pontilimi TaxID=2691042 RepID=A0A7C9IQI8_9RHOB|nr:amino acid permease [Kangsaoukella pontilimi]MXQ06386.1 amino acid permease [Kangsaoukella pontilimi]